MAEAASRSAGAAKAPASGGAAAAATAPVPAPGFCHFFLAQKNRYCRWELGTLSLRIPRPILYTTAHQHTRPTRTLHDRFQAPQGQTLCSHHAAAATAAAGGERRRVPCPVDPNHSVYEDRLDKHVAVCSSRPPPRPAFAQARANRPDEALYAAWAADGGGGPTPALQETPADTIHAIIAKIQAAAARLLPPEVGAGGVVDGWMGSDPAAIRSPSAHRPPHQP